MKNSNINGVVECLTLGAVIAVTNQLYASYASKIQIIGWFFLEHVLRHFPGEGLLVQYNKKESYRNMMHI